MNRVCYWLLVVGCWLLFTDCNSPRYLKDNEILLNRSIVSGFNPEDADRVKAFLSRQKPNRRILGIKPYLGFYNLGSHFKNQNNWLQRKVGEPPVIYDSVSAENTRLELLNYLQNKGYFNAKVKLAISVHKRRAKLKYFIIYSKPYKIKDIVYTFEDENVESIINSEDKEEKLLKTGAIFDIETLKGERNRLENKLKNNGYYYYNKEYIFYEVDTTAGKRGVNLKVLLKKIEPDKNNRIYFIKDVYVITDADDKNTGSIKDTSIYKNIFFLANKHKYSNKVLYRKIYLRPTNTFKMNNVISTQNYLKDMGIFKFVNIRQEDVSDSTHNFLRTFIMLSALEKYSYAVQFDFTWKETEGVQTPGIGGLGTFTIRNVFGGAQILNTRLHAGTDIQTKLQEGYEGDLFAGNQEIGADVSIIFPFFWYPTHSGEQFRPYNPKTRITSGFFHEKRKIYNRTNTNFTYNFDWRKNKYSQTTFVPFNVNLIFSKPTPEFKEFLLSEKEKGNLLIYSFEPSFVTSSRLIHTYNNSAYNVVKKSIFFRGHLEVGGYSFYLLRKLFDPEITSDSVITIRRFRIFRFQKGSGDLRYYLPVKHTGVWANRIYLGMAYPGIKTSTLPYDKFFFSGGSNSNRGWKSRRLGPGSYHSLNDIFEQPGEIVLETNTELRFNVVNFINGAFFVDAGNIWMFKPEPTRTGSDFQFKRFYKEIAMSGGTGLRLDFSFIVIRLDWAFRILDPAMRSTGEDIFVANRLDGIYHVGIGYPF